MYLIKSKPGYNVIINDIGITVRANSSGVVISKEQYESSKDIKKIEKYLIIEKINKTVESKKVETEKVVVKTDNSTFVKQVDVQETPKGIFVAQPKVDKEVKVEKVDKKEDIILVTEEKKDVEGVVKVIEEIIVEKIEDKKLNETPETPVLSDSVNTDEDSDKTEAPEKESKPRGRKKKTE